MSGPDILIIKPGSQKLLYGTASDYRLTAIEPPLWAALLAGHLRSQGYGVALLDQEVEGLSPEETARRIETMRPLLTLVSVSGTNPSASTMNMGGAGRLVSRLKEIQPTFQTAFQGLHPSSLPARTLREECVDFVIQGEGFFTLGPLLDALRGGQRQGFTMPGLWWRENGTIHSSPRPANWGNLDDLPMPAWDLLPMGAYRAHNWHCFDDITRRQPYGVIYTSLGCPFRCSFCCINALFGKAGIRFRSPEKVIEEIDFLVEGHGIRNIKIIDEMFVLRESHVIDLCDRIIARGYDLNLWAYARVNTVKPVILQRMRRAGIRWLAYGFESGNQRVLQAIDKPDDLETARQAVRMTYAEGIHIAANFIFGLPEDDRESMRETLQLAMEINAEWANFYPAMAYPGSALYRQAVEQGLPLPDTWEGYSPYAYETLPLPTRHLTAQEVLRFRDQAFDAYFKDSGYLNRIEHLFGRETVAHIQEMTRHTLRRKADPTAR